MIKHNEVDYAKQLMNKVADKQFTISTEYGDVDFTFDVSIVPTSNGQTLNPSIRNVRFHDKEFNSNFRQHFDRTFRMNGNKVKLFLGLHTVKDNLLGKKETPVFAELPNNIAADMAAILELSIDSTEFE